MSPFHCIIINNGILFPQGVIFFLSHFDIRKYQRTQVARLTTLVILYVNSYEHKNIDPDVCDVTS